KCGQLELKAVLQHDDYTEMGTDRIRAREKCLHSFRARVGGDVVILRCQTSHHVTHATAREVRDVPLLTQARRDFTRALFRGRRFHTTTVAASLREAQSTCRSAPKAQPNSSLGQRPRNKYVAIPSAEGAIQTHV